MDWGTLLDSNSEEDNLNIDYIDYFDTANTAHNANINMIGFEAGMREYEGRTSLMDAIFYNRYDLVAILLAKPGIDVNIRGLGGKTALIWAVEKGCVEIVWQLLAHPNIDVNAQDSRGMDALKYALFRNQYNIVARLLAVPGIDVNIRGLGGKTALMLAVAKGYEDIACHLLEYRNIDVNAQDSRGMDALKYALYGSHYDIVARLLAVPGIDVNAKNNYGSTALMIAASNGLYSIVRKLLQFPEIDINLQCGKSTAAMYAAKRGYVDIVGALAAVENKNNFTNFILSSFRVAIHHKSFIKYFIYSGKSLLSNDGNIFIDNTHALEKLESLHTGNFSDAKQQEGNIFIREKHGLLSSLVTAVKDEVITDFPNRVNLLAAKICGVTFRDDIIVNHTGMSVAKFKWVSSLMQLSILTKLAYKFNEYIVMHTLMLRDSIGDFCKLPHVMIANILDFLSGEHFDMSICKMSSTLSLDPRDLKSPIYMKSSSSAHGASNNISNLAKRLCQN